jgi:AbrB family looped-hinge helix DNA binding protein
MISKIVKVSDKGQISLPIEIRRKVGIERDDSLMIMQLDNRIIIEKPQNLVKDSFSDLNSEAVAKKLWDNEYDEIWNDV